MANLGRVLAVILLLLFVTKAFAANLFPVVKQCQQVLLLDENQENQDSDELEDLKFLDFYCIYHQYASTITSGLFSFSKKSISYYNSSLYIGYIHPAFRPPCNI